jgi:hypothetical protein
MLLMKCNLTSLFLEIDFRCLEISDITMQPVSVSVTEKPKHTKSLSTVASTRSHSC